MKIYVKTCTHPYSNIVTWRSLRNIRHQSMTYLFRDLIQKHTKKKKDLNHDIIVALSPSTIYDPVFELILSNTKISRIIAPDKYALVAKR